MEDIKKKDFRVVDAVWGSDRAAIYSQRKYSQERSGIKCFRLDQTISMWGEPRLCLILRTRPRFMGAQTFNQLSN